MQPDCSDKPQTNPETVFAPADLTDGRKPGEWRSRYDNEAWSYIWQEAAYLSILLVLAVALMLLVWLRCFQHLWHLSCEDQSTLSRYSFAWLGGTLGGILFAMKWQYHSVAKLMWHLDRRLWRYLTPHISGGLAFASFAIVGSFDAHSSIASSAARAFSFGFLVGFFSDNALAKLAEVAETLLGPTKRFAARHKSDLDWQ